MLQPNAGFRLVAVNHAIAGTADDVEIRAHAEVDISSLFVHLACATPAGHGHGKYLIAEIGRYSA